MPASVTDTVRNFVAVLILKITGDAEMVVAARNLTYFVCMCVCVCVCVCVCDAGSVGYALMGTLKLQDCNAQYVNIQSFIVQSCNFSQPALGVFGGFDSLSREQY